MKLLEREHLLDQLADQLAESRRGRGRFVLVAGEAGIGKTALVETFCRERIAGAPVLWGSCDPVVPARPFAPITDIAERLDGPLRAALQAEDRERVFEESLTILRQMSTAGGVVVLEDLHWADDATLDLVRIVGRRLREIPLLLVGTYRDDEAGARHPLRLALGDVPAAATREVRVPPLSIDAVRTLARGSRLDGDVVHRATRGNPFFVTEALAADSIEVPVAVSDSVLARVARMTPPAQHALRAASVLGERCESDLLRAISGNDQNALAECIARGMLEADGSLLRFRHQLAQRAMREGLAPEEMVAFHRRAFEVLRRLDGDPSILAHHAQEADDAEGVAEFAPLAAERAAVLGAHREAAAHYAAALRFGSDKLPEKTRAELLEGHARESLVVDDVDAALTSQNDALACWQRVGDLRREAGCMRALSQTLWVAGQADRAVEAADRAVRLLESTSAPDSELARAYATLALRHMTRGRSDETALMWAERARALAERAGDEFSIIHALTTVGTIESVHGADSGWLKLEQSARRAQSAAFKEEASRALINIVEAARDTRRYSIVDRYRDEAVAYMNDQEPDHDLHRRRLLSVLAEVALERGRFDEADLVVRELLAEKRSSRLIRVKALTVLGRLQARRGGSDPWPLLDEASALSGSQGETQDLCPLFAARAEAAWLEGDLARTRLEAEAGFAVAMEVTPMPWWRGELGFWAWKAGALDRLPADAAEPYLLHATERFQEAASSWDAIGCPYQQGLALADAPDEEALRHALQIFRSLAAEPMTRQVLQRLRVMGARGISRGPRDRTLSNPAGLTPRELEVLLLLAEGLRNADIAERLVVSPKTVDHHVSAILRKLAVPNRSAAAEEATRLGLKDRGIAVAE